MTASKKFAFDVGITFIASSISMLLGFVITIILGRYLGAEELGLYRMSSTIYAIALLVAAIGIPSAIIKYVAEYKENRTKLNSIISSGVITSLLLGILFSIILYLLSGILEGIFKMQGLAELLKILSPVFPFALVGGVLLGVLNGLREMKKYGMATIIQSVLMMVISVLLIYSGYGVKGVMIGVVMASVGWCFYLLFITRDYFKITYEEYEGNTKRILAFGSQIFGTNAINMIIYQADTIMIGFFLTASQVGFYGVALGLSNFFSIVPRAIQIIVYPLSSEYWANKNHTALQATIEKSMKYTACILLPVGLGIEFLSGEIITKIFGDSFFPAILPLQILIIGTMASNIVGSVGGSLTSIGRPDLGMRIAGISAIINIVSNILFIPRFGIEGAAIASVISLSTSALLSLYFIRNVTSIKIDAPWYFKIVSLSIVFLFLFFSIIKIMNPILIGFSFLSIYIFLIYVFFLKEEDKKLLKSTLQSISKIF